LNTKIGILWIFVFDFGLQVQDTFQDEILLQSPEMDQDKAHMKFAALNVDFNARQHQIGVLP